MSGTGRQKPSNVRVGQLANELIDPTVVLGPLDHDDLREICCELLELRARQPMIEKVPTLQAADAPPEVACA